MTDRDDQFDELLSAYVDGELTADERAIVEERLRTDSDARELVEELRSIASAIRSLPRESLGRDLRASIQDAIDARADDQRHVIPLSEPLDPPRGFYRGFLWSTIAIAAALMIMFLEYRDQPGERDLAVATSEKAGEAEELTARNNRRRELLEDGKLPPAGEMRALSEPLDAPQPSAGEFAGRAATTQSLPAAAPASPAPADKADADALAAREVGEKKVRLEPSQADAAKRSLDVASAEVESLAEATDRNAAMSDAVPPPPLQAPQEAAELAFGTASAAARPAGAVDNETSDASTAAPIETVELQVRREGGVQQFTQLLAETNFRLPAPPTAESPAAPQTRLQAQAATSSAGSQQLYFDEAGGVRPSLEGPGNHEVQIVVEGTPVQIEQLVQSYRRQPEVFAEVDAPAQLSRRASEFHRRDSFDAEGESVERASEPIPQDPIATGKPSSSSYGLAWFVVPHESHDDATLYSFQNGEPKEKAEEATLQLGATIQSDSRSSRFSAGRAGGGAAPAAGDLAKQLQSPPEAGRVRMKFVLRPAPLPAAAAEPASSEPQ